MLLLLMPDTDTPPPSDQDNTPPAPKTERLVMTEADRIALHTDYPVSKVSREEAQRYRHLLR